MGGFRTWLLVAVALGGSVCCGGEPEPLGLGHVQAPIIYGEDDRVEAQSYPDAVMRALADDVVGALISSEYVSLQANGDYVLAGPTLGQRVALCSGEPLLEQPSLAHCTGILAQDNTLITAGHCVDEMQLGDTYFVQGYSLGSSYLNVPARRVHALKRILTSRNADIGTESGEDFAIVQLATQEPLPSVAFATPAIVVQERDPIVVIGTSEGLPLKIEAGATVFDAAPADYFEVTSDTFQGGSGSPVFASGGAFVGIVVGGAIDYVWDDEQQCNLRSRKNAPAERGELVVRASVLHSALRSGLKDVVRADAGCSTQTAIGVSVNQRGFAALVAISFWLAASSLRKRR